MPKLEFTASESSGWKPLPTGTYDFQIDSLKVGTKDEAPQLIFGMHVVGGAHDGKKANDFIKLTAASGWRLKLYLDATGIGYEEEDTGTMDDEDRPIMKYAFDQDDFPGTYVRIEVTEGEWNGKPKNNFKKILPVPGKEGAAAAPKAAAKTAAAPAATAPAAQPAAAGEPRRRVMRGAAAT